MEMLDPSKRAEATYYSDLGIAFLQDCISVSIMDLSPQWCGILTSVVS